MYIEVYHAIFEQMSARTSVRCSVMPKQLSEVNETLKANALVNRK